LAAASPVGQERQVEWLAAEGVAVAMADPRAVEVGGDIEGAVVANPKIGEKSCKSTGGMGQPRALHV
jgi:hypothetical protein